MKILGSVLLVASLTNGLNEGFAFGPEHLKAIVTKAERDFTLPPGLLHAIIQQESSFQVKAVNLARNKGVKISSFGLGQLTLPSAKWYCNLKKKQIYNPQKNIRCAATIINYQLKRYKGHVRRAVAAYNWGTPCECNGKVFKQKLAKFTRTCKHKTKGIYIPIRCKKSGSFLNQSYVDNVLQKRIEVMKDSKSQYPLLSSLP